MVSVNVGDVKNYLEDFCLVDDYDSIKLADSIEQALQYDWEKKFDTPESYEFDYINNQWQSLLSSLLE